MSWYFRLFPSSIRLTLTDLRFLPSISRWSVPGKGLGISGKVLLVPVDEERNLDLASRNNPRLRVRRVMGLNVVDLLDYEVLVVSEAAIRRLEEVLA